MVQTRDRPGARTGETPNPAMKRTGFARRLSPDTLARPRTHNCEEVGIPMARRGVKAAPVVVIFS
jgi:hypothetical protein